MYSGTYPTSRIKPPPAHELTREKTSAYRIYDLFAYQWPRRRPIWSLAMADMMRFDHQVWFALNVSNAPLQTAEVEVRSPHEDVKRFVQEQWDRIWQTSCHKILRTKTYGYCGYEVVYKWNKGHLEFSHMLDRHPRDVIPLVTKVGKHLVGVRCRQSEGSSAEDLAGMKGLWLTYSAEFGQPYGHALLERAYPAWYDKAQEGGAYDLRRLRCIKDAWVGDQLKYPQENVAFPGTNGEVIEVPARDIAREIVENRASGGVLQMPSTTYQDGKPKWEYIPPQSIQGQNEAQQWIEHLDEDIFDGMLVPKEVVEAAATGSGFSGRSIPMLSFLASRDVEFAGYVEPISSQVLKRLARRRFGKRGDDFEILPKPLAKTFGEQVGQGPAGGAVGQGQQQQGPPQGGGQGQWHRAPGPAPDAQMSADWDEADHPRDDDGTFKLANAPAGKKKSAEFHDKKSIQKNLIDGLDALPGQKDLFEPEEKGTGWTQDKKAEFHRAVQSDRKQSREKTDAFDDWFESKEYAEATRQLVKESARFRTLENKVMDEQESVGEDEGIHPGPISKQLDKMVAERIAQNGGTIPPIVAKDLGIKESSNATDNPKQPATFRWLAKQLFSAQGAPGGPYTVADQKHWTEKAKKLIESGAKTPQEVQDAIVNFKSMRGQPISKAESERLQKVLDAMQGKSFSEDLPKADQFDVDPGTRWITIGGKKDGDKDHKGGFPVQIDGNGNIVKGGPKALRGKHVSQVGEHFKAEREGRTKEGKGRFHDEQGPSRNWKEIVRHQAERWDISPDEYESAADQVWRDKTELMQTREAAKADARGRLGITAGDVGRLENKGIDSGSKSSAKGLGTVGRTLASEYPELGWGQGYGSGDDQDYAALVWDLIREGKQTIPSRTSKDYHEAVEEYLEYALTQTASTWKPDPAAQFSVGTKPTGRAVAADIRRRLGKLLQKAE